MEFLFRWAAWVVQYVLLPFRMADQRPDARRLTLGCALILFAAGAGLLFAFR